MGFKDFQLKAKAVTVVYVQVPDGGGGALAKVLQRCEENDGEPDRARARVHQHRSPGLRRRIPGLIPSFSFFSLSSIKLSGTLVYSLRFNT